MKRILLSCMSLFFVLMLCGCNTNTTTSTDSDKTSQQQEQPSNNEQGVFYFTTEMEADYEVTMEVENYGSIVIELDEDKAPVTVQNFVKLIEEGFYDGLTFHRIMAGFMMQGGDPTGTGFSGSDEEIVGEFAANGCKTNDLSHVRGAISMARSTAFDSASSQFFIVHENSEFLDGQYAAFGYVTSGMEVVDAICNDAKPIDNNGGIAADQQPKITSMKVKALN